MGLPKFSIYDCKLQAAVLIGNPRPRFGGV